MTIPLKLRPLEDRKDRPPCFSPFSQRVKALAFLLGVLLCLWPGSAFSGSFQEEKETLWSTSLGLFTIKEGPKSGAFRIEVQSGKRLWKFIPLGGLIVTTDVSFYGYAGLGLEFCLTPDWRVIPRLAVGIFHPFTGAGLGHPLEFFSSLEVAYRFKDRSRLGLSFGHLSNGGITNNNPGTEPLFLTYTVPLEYLLCHFRTR